MEEVLHTIILTMEFYEINGIFTPDKRYRLSVKCLSVIAIFADTIEQLRDYAHRFDHCNAVFR